MFHFSYTDHLYKRQEKLIGKEILCAFDQVADNATLYGVCLLVPEIVQRAPAILGSSSPHRQRSVQLCHFLVSAPRCYCLLTKIPFFELHFEMLNRFVLIVDCSKFVRTTY